MTEQNIYAIIAVLAIVVTFYAVRDGHTRYLLDLVMVAGAIVTPRPSLALAAAGIAIVIRHTTIAGGLADIVPIWLQPIALPGACNMSRFVDSSTPAPAGLQAPAFEDESDLDYVEIPQPVAENAPETISSPEIEIMARAVLGGVLGLTEATQLLAGAKGGKKYQKSSRLLKLEMDRQRNHYPAGSNLKRFE